MMIRVSYVIFTESDVKPLLSLTIAITWPVSIPGMCLYFCLHIIAMCREERVKLPAARVLDNGQYR